MQEVALVTEDFEKLPAITRIWRRCRGLIAEIIQAIFPSLRPAAPSPNVLRFSPVSGYYGTVVKIEGEYFSGNVADNDVKIGGQPALIVSATVSEIVAIVGKDAGTDKVTVTVGGATGASAMVFQILAYPAAGSGDDGPPLILEGQGNPSAGISPSGTLDILVTLVTPNDIAPTNPAIERTNVADTWDMVRQFYEQASFGDLTVNITVTSGWTTLSQNKAYYYDSGTDNIKQAGVLTRLMAEGAQAADDDGLDLDDYDLMVCSIFLDGEGIRAWGNFHNNSRFQDSGLGIDISTSNDLYLIAVDELSDWGRCAHETGHNIVDAPSSGVMADGASLGEDVYASDLIDRSVATAAPFEMMGSHDTHPLFSAYYMEQMGYYDTNNTRHIRHLDWDRNPRNDTFDIVAHGLARNTLADRCHAVKIKVSDGLFYYIEARQRPGTTAQVFDDNIPTGGATNDGGVIVTKVYTDVVNVNQQIRFITLLHDPIVLTAGQSAADPARSLTITVEDDNVSARPVICRTRVQWAQNIADVPDGSFDLKIEPWDSDYQTPDIWVDRQPYGVFDNPADSKGRPTGNGDAPQEDEINHFHARIHNEGADPASNVVVTFYSVEPPGVGDNGNWGPLGPPATIASINNNDHQDISVNWTPIVDRHTCLKVYIQQQLGEVRGNNNQAQENVFDFEAASSSRPDAVVMSTAVRNPLDRPTVVVMQVRGVPEGYTVQFPHKWLWLEAKQEKLFDFTIVLDRDYWWYKQKSDQDLTARIKLSGRIPRYYREEEPPGVVPASRMLPIGGLAVNVTPKQRVELKISAGAEQLGDKGQAVYLSGSMTPALKDEVVRVEVMDPFGLRRFAHVTTQPDGSFNTQIDVSKPPEFEDALPPGHPQTFPLAGVHLALARTIQSPNAARAVSNLVTVDVR